MSFSQKQKVGHRCPTFLFKNDTEGTVPIVSFCLGVSQGEEFGFEFFAEIALDYDFTVLGRAAASAEGFQGAGKRLHIGLRTDETAYYGDGLAAAAVLFHAQAQLLLLGRQEFLLRFIISLIVEIRIGGVHDSKSVLPIVSSILSHSDDKYSASREEKKEFTRFYPEAKPIFKAKL